MSNLNKNNHEQQILNFLQKEGLADNTDNVRFTPHSGDGSSRLFFTIKMKASSYCGVLPSKEDTQKGLAEAHSTFNIGSHLKKRGIPVPMIHGFDPVSGFILFEDLGETLLHNFLQNKKKGPADVFGRETVEMYKEIIEMLLFMQISGSVRFDRKWCWDTQRYDKKLMLEKESGYFEQAFCRDLLGMNNFPDGLTDDFKLLAARAGRQQSVYFLHRDFQSRNLMISSGKVRIIDFQGGRLGPLGYDLASLLIDPYAQLPPEVQEELLEHYLEHLCTYGLDDLAFLKGYKSLALQRNLQILGAFAFLSGQKRKVFFKQFILPATLSLHHLLIDSDGNNYPHLLKLTEKILIQLDT